MKKFILASVLAGTLTALCSTSSIALAQCPGTRGNGDLDGDKQVTPAEVQRMSEHFVEGKALTACESRAADLDLSGSFDEADMQCAYEFFFQKSSCIRRLGDANGDGKTVAKADCSTIRNFRTGATTPTDVEIYRADVAPDGKLDLKDEWCIYAKELAAYRYDMNNDFKLDGNDLVWLFDFFLKKVSFPKNAQAACTAYLGDLDGDGIVSPADVQILWERLTAMGIKVDLPK